MRVQTVHVFLCVAAIFLAMDDAYLIGAGTPTAAPFLLSVLLLILPVTSVVRRRRVELKRLGDKLFTPFWAGMCTVAAYFFLLSDLGANMMYDRVSPLPKYWASAVFVILPVVVLIRNRRKLFATKA